MDLPARFPVLVQYRALGIPGEKVVDGETFVECLLQVWVHKVSRVTLASDSPGTESAESAPPWDLEHPEVRDALRRAVCDGRPQHLVEIVEITQAWRR